MAISKAVFGLPIRVEFEAYCMPGGVLDMSPRICAQSDGSGNTNTGFALLEGNAFNVKTTVNFFGKSSELPHTPLKANEAHKIVLSIDAQRHAEAQFDGETIFKGEVPANAKAEGHVMVFGGRGDVVYKRVVITGQAIAK